jgi:hypothetical protein
VVGAVGSCHGHTKYIAGWIRENRRSSFRLYRVAYHGNSCLYKSHICNMAGGICEDEGLSRDETGRSRHQSCIGFAMLRSMKVTSQTLFGDSKTCKSRQKSRLFYFNVSAHRESKQGVITDHGGLSSVALRAWKKQESQELPSTRFAAAKGAFRSYMYEATEAIDAMGCDAGNGGEGKNVSVSALVGD